jgi:sulfate transport system substrate-binding protein
MNSFRAPLRGVFLAAGFAALALIGAGCGGSSSASGGGNEIAVVGYSTPEAVYTDAIEPAFQDTPKGADVSFSNSFGASGDQRRAVEAGQEADIVHFAQGGDMIALEEGGQVDPSWDDNRFKGIGQESVVVIATRAGNPENIRSFRRPARAGRRDHHAEPAQLRGRALEHHGRLRLAAAPGRLGG